MVLVGNTYPISRKTDYEFPDKFVPGSVSKFHCAHPVPYDPTTGQFDMIAGNKTRSDKGLKAGFDSHFISISTSLKYAFEVLSDHSQRPDLYTGLGF